MVWNIYYSIIIFGAKQMDDLSLDQIIDHFRNNHLIPTPAPEQRVELDLCQGLGSHWKQTMAPPAKKVQVDRPVVKQGEPCSYYQLAMLLFPQVQSACPLDIDIMDTLFFLQDHSVCYVYKDSRKGLTRMKQRGINVCEMFIKRRNRIHHRDRSRFGARKSQTFTASYSSDHPNEQSGGSWGSLGYAALLKYKDQSFMMLKEADFRAIFTNPLYANQRFKHNNTAQYIQSLADEDAQEHRVSFSWHLFSEEPLMKLAEECVLGNVTATQRSHIRSELGARSKSIYLHFCVFEVVAYVGVNYNRQINQGVFNFVQQKQVWTMSYVEGVTVTTLPRHKFTKADLWTHTPDNFQEFREEGEHAMFQLQNQVKSKLLKEVQRQFATTNQRIRQDVTGFIEQKLDNESKLKDRMLSGSIFRLLHPNSKQDLHQLLDNPDKLAQVVVPPSPKPKAKFVPVKPQLQARKKPIQYRKSSLKNASFVYRGLDSSQF